MMNVIDSLGNSCGYFDCDPGKPGNGKMSHPRKWNDDKAKSHDQLEEEDNFTEDDCVQSGVTLRRPL